MDDWLRIPTDRPKVSAFRLCLIMGLTGVLLLASPDGPFMRKPAPESVAAP